MIAARGPGAHDLSAMLAERIGSLAPALLPAGRREHSEWRVGSVAGERGRSLGIQLTGDRRGLWCDRATGEGGDALDLVRATHRLDVSGSLRWARAWLGQSAALTMDFAFNPEAMARQRASEWREREARIAKAQVLWRAAAPISRGDLADLYLMGRLDRPATVWPGTLRFLPEVRHPSGVSTPALIAGAARWPDRKVAAVQLTALARPGRKADLEPVRWSLGALRGAAARLSAWRPGQEIVLVEGVEDGLAVLAAQPGAAVWACLGAANVASAVLPDGADALLALDGDDAGRRAAAAAANTFRARDHRVRVADLPAGLDPLEALLAGEGAGFLGKAAA